MTKTVFRMTNYDGGLPPHPAPEKEGTLTLTANHKWELRYRGFNRGARTYGGLARFQFEVTEAETSSCHVIMSDSQDPMIRAAFDLPVTVATVLQEKLDLHQPDKWCYAGFHRYPFEVTETGAASCHVIISDTHDPTIRATFDPPETAATLFRSALPPKARVPDFSDPRESSGVTERAAAPPPQSNSIVEDIKKLAELRDSGILTQAEFQAKKTELLARM